MYLYPGPHGLGLIEAWTRPGFPPSLYGIPGRMAWASLKPVWEVRDLSGINTVSRAAWPGPH